MATHYFDLNITYNCAGQFAENVFKYKIVDPSSTDDWELARQLVNVIDDGGAASWTTKWSLMTSNQAYISTIRARQFSPDGGNTCTFVAQPADFPGSIASEINTQQIAACINWIPTTSGPAMGRNFMPGVPENALDSSRWEVAHVALVDAFIAKHLTGFTVAAGIFLPIVWNRTDETAASIDQGYLSPKPGTQRSRERPL